ncbi:MAG: DnaD domain protein [Defluviitaleaceae bacterium]|nr:DnaD domain protein [Defluviitaleaceae bacterium]
MLNIVLGITGSVAAYKAAELANLLAKQGDTVDTIMTNAATKFVTPLLLQSLTKRRVYTEMFETIIYEDIRHISLAQRADVFVIAPASANIIGKIANGIADDMLSTVVMATKSPVIICPAMNTAMYENPIVQANIKKLEAYGYHFVDPKESRLACGDVGKGSMADVADIVAKINEFSTSSSKEAIIKNDEVKPIIKEVSYTIEEVERHLQNPNVRVLFEMAEEILGKPLQERERQMFLEIYLDMGLEIDVIEFLLQYCVDNGKKANNYIKSVAQNWAERGIADADEAEEYIRLFNNEYRNIMRWLGNSGREPINKEIEYMQRWIKEDGYSMQIIQLACEKTIINKATANFPYADGILNKWRKQNITTPEQIEVLEKQYFEDKEINPFKRKIEKAVQPRRFQNFKGRTYDHERLAQLEREYVDRKLGK